MSASSEAFPVAVAGDDENTTELTPPEPVFVDPSGRRRRGLGRIFLAGGLVLAGFLALFVTAVFDDPRSPGALLPPPPAGPVSTGVGGIGAVAGNPPQPGPAAWLWSPAAPPGHNAPTPRNPHSPHK
jgi:hypothetical protein